MEVDQTSTGQLIVKLRLLESTKRTDKPLALLEKRLADVNLCEDVEVGGQGARYVVRLASPMHRLYTPAP